MHNYIVNATIQLLPITQDKHPYHWINEVVMVIQQTEVKYKIGPFATVIEGTYQQVMDVFDAVNRHLVEAGCNEWITSLQLNMRCSTDITANEKLAKFISQ